MKKMREVFADTMLDVGQVDPKLVVMVGDISHGILQPYARACEGRYFNIGICEPSTIGIAAGMAKVGLTPVVHTIAPFIIERGYEQIKLDFGYQKQGVNLISVGSAFDYSQLGCSHHCYTDLSLMSHFNKGQVFFPASPVELQVLFKAVYNQGTINYFRLPEKTHGVAFAPEMIEVGKGIKVREGEHLTLVVVGSLLKQALEAAESLSRRGVETEVLYYHTIKPFDEQLLQESARKSGKVLVVEEASAHDGVFNLCLRACHHIDGVRYESIAIEDFLHVYGTYEELLEEVGMDSESICSTALEKFALVEPAVV